MLQGKNKLCKTKEEEGDDSYRRLFRGAAPLQLPLFLPTLELCCKATSQQEKEGGAAVVQLHSRQEEEGGAAAVQLHSR